MATLFQKKSGLYLAQFYDSSRRPPRKRKSLETKNKRLAERLLAKLERDHLLGLYDPWAPPGAEHHEPDEDEGEGLRRLGAAVRAYMDTCSHLSPNTLRTYRSIFELFRDHLGVSCEVGRIGPDDVLSFLGGTDANLVTRHKYVSHLGYLFRFLVGRGAMERDVSKEVKLPRLPEQAPKSMTPSEVETLVQTIHAYTAEREDDWRVPDYRWLAGLVWANVHLGLRLGELTHLTWDHVELERRTLAVRNSAAFTTKRGKERVLPVPEPALEVLRGLREEGGERPSEKDEHRVFTSHRGELKAHYLGQTFLTFRRLAGLPDGISFHSTRHTYATWMAERGVPVGIIKELMGHASVTTTERYMQVRPATARHWVGRVF